MRRENEREKHATEWRTYVLVALSLVLVFFVGGNAAKAEIIRHFDVDMKLEPDCSLDVIETIDMDFEDSSRHGIFRNIPIQYSRYGGHYTLDVKVLSVTDEQNHPWSYVENRGGADLSIKIGKLKQLVTGQHTYRIHYLVRRAINFFDKRPEVYWNVTGNDWPYGMQQVVARFYPPQGINLSDIKTTCFVGRVGSRTPGEIERPAGQSQYVEFKASNLNAGEGLTIVSQLPAGSVTSPSAWQEFVWLVRDWWTLAVFPVLTGLYITPILLKRKLDPDGHRAVAVEWNAPKNLSPAEVGTLVDESCDMQDIVSTLVDLAARGYLQIKELKTQSFLFFSTNDYEFTKLDPPAGGDSLLPHEKEFLSALFGSYKKTVKLSDLKEKFYSHLPKIRDGIYQSLTSKKLFVENPEKVRMRYSVAAFIIVLVGICMVRHVIGWGVIISGFIILATAHFMPARTREGWARRAECLGFQRFVRMAEKDRIAVLAKDDPTIFGRLLPFAMVLGAADQWADAFRDLLTEPPSWYVPYGYGNPTYSFSSSDFVHDLGGGMNTMGRTFSSTPSSSAGSGGSGFSGGSSGGGFGGGGGGSW